MIGEVLLDATLTQFEPLDDPTAILALHVDDFAFVAGVNGAPSATIPLPKGSLYVSGCPPLTSPANRLRVSTARQWVRGVRRCNR